MWCGGRLSAAGKQIRGGERRRSGNSSGAVDGCDSGAAAVRRRTAWSEWFWYGARRRRRRGGSSASASAAKSLRALRLRLRWTTTSGYRLRRDGGGRRWIGRYGVEDGGGWGFAAGGEGVLAPTEYEWGNGGRRGTKGEQCFGLRRACLKFGESYKLCPHLKFRTYCGLGVGQSCQVSQMWAG